MFFSISKHRDDRFPNHQEMQGWVISHDNGWHKQPDKLCKGYRYADLDHGNFCQIRADGHTIFLEHDLERSFPLWWDPETKTLTNCVGTGQKIWTDQAVSLDNNTLVTEKKDIVSLIDTDVITLEQALPMIRSRFESKIEKLKSEILPIKLFVSGGVDTMYLYSIMRQAEIRFELVDYEHFDYDQFTNHFIKPLRTNYWAYRQIHHWRKPCILTTGGCGDEYLFRGPNTVAIWAAWHGIDLVRIMSQQPKGYMVSYLMREKNRKIFDHAWQNRQQILDNYPTKEHLMRYVIDINLNDHQQWHLGHTLTWTPFKDIEIFKIMLRLDNDSLLRHWINAELNCSLIDAKYRIFVSDSKNELIRQNLSKFIDCVSEVK